MFIEALCLGHDAIAKLNELQNKLYALVHNEKWEFTAVERPQELTDFVEKHAWELVRKQMRDFASKKTNTTRAAKELMTMLTEKRQQNFLKKPVLKISGLRCRQGYGRNRQRH